MSSSYFPNKPSLRLMDFQVSDVGPCWITRMNSSTLIVHLILLKLLLRAQALLEFKTADGHSKNASRETKNLRGELTWLWTIDLILILVMSIDPVRMDKCDLPAENLAEGFPINFESSHHPLPPTTKASQRTQWPSALPPQ